MNIQRWSQVKMCVYVWNALKKGLDFLSGELGSHGWHLWTISREVVTEAWWHYGLVEWHCGRNLIIEIKETRKCRHGLTWAVRERGTLYCKWYINIFLLRDEANGEGMIFFRKERTIVETSHYFIVTFLGCFVFVFSSMG